MDWRKTYAELQGLAAKDPLNLWVTVVVTTNHGRRVVIFNVYDRPSMSVEDFEGPWLLGASRTPPFSKDLLDLCGDLNLVLFDHQMGDCSTGIDRSYAG